MSDLVNRLRLGDTRLSRATLNETADRIEALEAALRKIALNAAGKPWISAEIARDALAPERRHTTPEATDRKDWPKDGFINDYD